MLPLHTSRFLWKIVSPKSVSSRNSLRDTDVCTESSLSRSSTCEKNAGNTVGQRKRLNHNELAIKASTEFTRRFELDWPLELPRIEVEPGLFILQHYSLGVDCLLGRSCSLLLRTIAEEALSSELLMQSGNLKNEHFILKGGMDTSLTKSTTNC